MWFKNAHIFNLEEQIDYEPESLAEKLEESVFKPCGKLSPVSTGWVAPMNKDNAPLVHAGNKLMLLCLKQEEKILPAPVLNEQLHLRVTEIEAQQDRKVRTKERKALKDEIYFTLLPQAFSKSSNTYAYFDCQQQVLIVDVANRTKAEEFTEYLRTCLGSLKLSAPEVQTPTVLMTHWLNSRTFPTSLEPNDAGVLADTQENGAIIRCQKQDMLSDNVRAFLKQGCDVTQLALSWNEQVDFVLKDNFSLAQIKFSDLVKEQANESFTETDQERFDADFTIMTETLRVLLIDLMLIFAKQAKQEKQELAEAL